MYYCFLLYVRALCMLAIINREAIEKRASKLGLPVHFHDGIDHMKLTQYSVFVNPSVSEVLCTTIAEVHSVTRTSIFCKILLLSFAPCTSLQLLTCMHDVSPYCSDLHAMQPYVLQQFICLLWVSNVTRIYHVLCMCCCVH
jgi:hypothetical protein